MKTISKFYTILWIVYFPCCVAFTLILNFDFLDELMAIALVVYAVGNSNNLDKSRYRNNEITRFVLLTFFYLAYSFFIQITTTRGILLDFLQQLRPYMVFYTTWVMAPQFTKEQRKNVKYTLVLTLFVFTILYFVNPDSVIQYYNDKVGKESNTFGQLAVYSAMIYYLFSKKSKGNRIVTLIILFVGLLSGKSKYIGECIVFVSLIMFVKGRIRLNSPKTYAIVGFVAVLVIFFTWTKFNTYYVEGFQKTEKNIKARPASYKTAVIITFHDYVPFGSGLGSFATAAAAKEYSPLYYKYGLSRIWGMSRDFPDFIADAYFPSLAEFGVVGLLFFFLFWKRRVKEMQQIPNLACYRMAWMCFMALMLESTADTSYLSGKGMGYFMILAVCLNSAKYEFEEEYVAPEKYGFLESIGNGLRSNNTRV